MFVLGAARVVVLAADSQPPASATDASLRQEQQVPGKTSLIKKISEWYVYRTGRHRGATQPGCFHSFQRRANRLPSNTCPINSVCEGLQTPTAAAAPEKEGIRMQII